MVLTCSESIKTKPRAKDTRGPSFRKKVAKVLLINSNPCLEGDLKEPFGIPVMKCHSEVLLSEDFFLFDLHLLYFLKGDTIEALTPALSELSRVPSAKLSAASPSSPSQYHRDAAWLALGFL